MDNWVIRQRVDLQLGAPPVQVWPGALMYFGDKLAHTWRVDVLSGGAPVDLTGGSVTATFIRGDGITVPVTGVAGNGFAEVTLTEVCYAAPGELRGVMRATVAGVTLTLSALVWRVSAGETDVIVDPTGTIPSLSDLLAQIATIEAATTAATTAAETATTAATHAEDAADAIDGLTASASTLPTGADATATVTLMDGVHHIALGLPRGEKGDQGVPGMGNVSTVCGVQPDNAGNVTLMAGNVGATPSSHASDTANPHGVTAAQVGAATSAALTAHTGATDNPHGVTAAQVGAPSLPVLLLDGVSWLAAGASPITVPGLSGYAYVIIDAGAYGVRKFAVGSAIFPTFFMCTTAGSMYIYDSRVGISGDVMTLSVSKRILLSVSDGSVTTADNPTSITISIWGCNA